jgi:hypothetical protein
MNSDDTNAKVPWEAPATTALTDSASRTDQPYVALRNVVALSPSP